MTATVNTKAEQVEVKALQADLDSALIWINVSLLDLLPPISASNLLSIAENHQAFARKGQHPQSLFDSDSLGSIPRG
jgi:hypothetical protein